MQTCQIPTPRHFLPPGVIKYQFCSIEPCSLFVVAALFSLLCFRSLGCCMNGDSTASSIPMRGGVGGDLCHIEAGSHCCVVRQISRLCYFEAARNIGADHSGRAVEGMNCLRSPERWDHEFESRSRHGCLCAFILFVLSCATG
jgi:hypothetical protein